MKLTYKDLTGQRFGRLIALRRAGTDCRGYALWECKCDCGNVVNVSGTHLRRGSTVSCKCYRKEIMPLANRKHGLSMTRVHKIWAGMLNRCNPAHAESIPNYAGRGITVCERWKSFENFYRDMGYPPSKHSIERINNDRGYEPGNCRWATSKEQLRNTRFNRWLDYNGKRLVLTDWSIEVGIKSCTIAKRLNYGWSVERALTEPVRKAA